MTLEEFRTLKPGDEIIMRYPTDNARDNIKTHLGQRSFTLLDTLISNRFPVRIMNISTQTTPVFSIDDIGASFSWQWADCIAHRGSEILEFATDEEFMSLFK